MSFSQATENRIPTTPPVLNERTVVTVYEEADFQGASQSYTYVRRVGAPDQDNSPIRIDFHDLGIGNDSLSSLKISGAFPVRVTLFEDAGFQGRSKVVTGLGVVNYIGDDFNDRTSSLTIQPM